MTGPIIPADQWPEWADRHCWDADGDGYFYGVVRPTSTWWWRTEAEPSGIPMPAGHDWRVPVMRPAAVPAIDRDRLLSALERAAAAETELARLRDQQQSPAIDLEQFREAVTHFRDSYAASSLGPDSWQSAKAAEADRLLALIDGKSVSEKPQKRRCPNNAAPGGCQLPNRFCTFPDCEKADKLLPSKGDAVVWVNCCDRTVPDALRFLANHPRPDGGESRFNAAHLFQLAEEIEHMASAPLYTVPMQPSKGEGVGNG